MIGAMIELEPVAFEDKGVLRELVNFYLYDLSHLDDADPNAHGRFEYRWLDAYWFESTRHPFFIRRDGALAGFVLVSVHAVTGAAHGISEFFVMKRHRRHGVGRAAAHAAFRRFPGTWELRTEKHNADANAFWTQTLGGLPDLVLHPDGFADWAGPVWTFRIT
jgi:predicted acetyltransferase